MLRSILKVGALALALAGIGGTASAQTYEGSSVIKFGAFGQWGKVGVKQTAIGSIFSDASGNDSGFQGGVSAGIDFHLPYRFLIGVEMDGSFGDTGPTIGTGTPLAYSMDYLFNVRGRLGYYVHPSWLIYGTVGGSWLGFEAQNKNLSFKHSETVNGIVYGGGLEFDLHHVLMFAEYLHGSYDSREFGSGLFRVRSELDSDVVRVGLKFRVGNDYEHIGRHYDPEPLK